MKYTLDDLMRVTGESEITVRGKKKTYWFRTLSHADADARQNYASARARVMLRKIKDKKSKEYRDYLQELGEVDRQELEDALVTLYTQMVLSREAQKEILPVDEPEPPDDPTITDIIEAEEANEQIAKDVESERQKWLDESSKAYREELKSVDVAELVERAQKLRGDQVVNAEYAQAFQDATLYYGVWKDESYRKRMFLSPEQTRECDGSLRLQLLAAYYNVDGFSVEADELKN